jgi:hypothetical protein
MGGVGNTTVNPSPPVRQTVSWARVWDRRTSAKARRALSPAAWPNASLIAFGSMTRA